MPDKRIFKIGQLVKVNLNKQVKADYEGNHRVVKRIVEWRGYKGETDDLVLARITGVKQFWEGEYTPGYRGSWDHYESEEPYTSQDNQVVVWCVRLGYRNKELYYFEEDIHDAQETVIYPKHGEEIPYVYSGWTDHSRKKMSRESKDWPRDKKGRWTK